MQVIYPGTFDPPTNGHLDIIRRAAAMFDKVAVVIADNPYKQSFFNSQERLAMVASLTENLDNTPSGQPGAIQSRTIPRLIRAAHVHS